MVVSIAEAARVLGVAEGTLRSVLPEIPHFYIGRRVVIPIEPFKQWMADQAKAVGFQRPDDIGPRGCKDAVVSHGRIHGQLQVIKAQPGKRVDLIQYWCYRKIHCSELHAIPQHLFIECPEMRPDVTTLAPAER